MPTQRELAKEFFDRISDDYTSMIQRCVPRYTEMLQAIVHYLPSGFAPHHVLELGCGTGNLSKYVLDSFPSAQLTLVDISGEIIQKCRKRFYGHTEIIFEQADFKDLTYGHQTFDLVVSSIAIHHISHQEKARLFKLIYNWLVPGGIFAYSDQFAGATEEIYRKHIETWREDAFVLGATQKEWDEWMKHQEENDFHATLSEQIKWLQDAGFVAVDCTWRYLLWTVIHAHKTYDSSLF